MKNKSVYWITLITLYLLSCKNEPLKAFNDQMQHQMMVKDAYLSLQWLLIIVSQLFIMIYCVFVIHGHLQSDVYRKKLKLPVKMKFMDTKVWFQSIAEIVLILIIVLFLIYLFNGRIYTSDFFGLLISMTFISWFYQFLRVNITA